MSTHITRDECALAEIDAIQQRDSMNPARGYNLAPGGQGMHAPAGSAVYDLMRMKVWNNPAWRRKLSDAFKDKPVSEATRAAHEQWRQTPEAKAQFSEIAKRPERRAKLSAVMHDRLANGYREYLSDVQRGKPRQVSEEGRVRAAAKRREYAASERGKAASRAGWETMRANPDNEAKRRAALTRHVQSDVNKQHCAALAAKSRKAVKDLGTGQQYESRAAAARAHDVSGPTIGYWIKQGRFAYV